MRRPPSEEPGPGRPGSAGRADAERRLDAALKAAFALDRGEEDVLRAARLPEAVLLRVREGAPVPSRGLPSRVLPWVVVLSAAVPLSVLGPAWMLAALPGWARSAMLSGLRWVVLVLLRWVLDPLLENVLALGEPAGPALVLLVFGLPVIVAAAGHLLGVRRPLSDPGRS